MRKSTLILLLLFAFQAYSQTNPFNCPTSLKTDFVHDVKDVFKQPSDTNRIDAFRYIQWYDCQNLTDDRFQESLFWIVPCDSITFHLKCKLSDSARGPLIFGVSAPGMRMVSSDGAIEGSLLPDGQWKITGHLRLHLFNSVTNKIVQQTIILDGIYSLFKVVERKGQHPLFDFYSGQ